MKFRTLLCILLAVIMLVGMTACTKNDPADGTPADETEDMTATEAPNATLDIPKEYLEPMTELLGVWGVRKGSLSDPLIGTKILMYEKTKDEVGFMLVDLDGNGIKELITAPIEEYASNGMVYDILTIKDGKAFHLANSLQATYHFCEDNTFILRTPTDDKTFTFKNVVIIGDEHPIETPITKEEASKFVLSQIKLTPFSALEK